MIKKVFGTWMTSMKKPPEYPNWFQNVRIGSRFVIKGESELVLWLKHFQFFSPFYTNLGLST